MGHILNILWATFNVGHGLDSIIFAKLLLEIVGHLWITTRERFQLKYLHYNTYNDLKLFKNVLNIF